MTPTLTLPTPVIFTMSPTTGRREARLRPEHASRYPDIRAGEWESAAVLSDRVMAGGLLRASPVSLCGRVLPGEHFEFRGGIQASARPRREDR